MEEISSEKLTAKEEESGGKNEGGNFNFISFIIFGIGSMLVWNAILTDLDFFMYYYPSRTNYISTLFSFLNFTLNVPFQFVLIFAKNLPSYKVQVTGSLIASIVLVIFIPVSIILFGVEKETEGKFPISFIVTCASILVLGLVNAVVCSSFFGLVSKFNVKYIVALSTGQGVSGIIMNVIQFIIYFCLKSLNGKNKEKAQIIGAILFFGSTVLILVVCLVFLFLSYKDEYFSSVLLQKEENQGKKYSALVEEEEEGAKLEQSENSWKSFVELIKAVGSINVLIFIVYLITFGLFPGFSLRFNFFEEGVNTNVIVTIFNVCDTLGRKLVSYITPRNRDLYICGLLRFLFLVGFPVTLYLTERHRTLSEVVFIILLALFSLTNGFGTSLAYGLAPMNVEQRLKGRAGSSVSFFNIVGIFSGTILGFAMSKLGDTISKK